MSKHWRNEHVSGSQLVWQKQSSRMMGSWPQEAEATGELRHIKITFWGHVVRQKLNVVEHESYRARDDFTEGQEGGRGEAGLRSTEPYLLWMRTSPVLMLASTIHIPKEAPWRSDQGSTDCPLTLHINIQLCFFMHNFVDKFPVIYLYVSITWVVADVWSLWPH